MIKRQSLSNALFRNVRPAFFQAVEVKHFNCPYKEFLDLGLTDTDLEKEIDHFHCLPECFLEIWFHPVDIIKSA